MLLIFEGFDARPGDEVPSAVAPMRVNVLIQNLGVR